MIVPIIEEAIENIKLKYPEATLSIETASTQYLIDTDAFHFGNLVYNLLDNAVKYCNEKPEIKITIKEENNCLKLEFNDNGIGINPKNIFYL